MMKRNFQDDLKYGLSRENAVMLKLRQHFADESIKNTKELYNDEYCGWDYESLGGLKWEVKSRRCCLKTYPTTILPVHKGEWGGNKDLYFCFNFVDGLYYIPYDATLFNTFSTRMMKIERAGKYDPPTLHYEIPISLLAVIQ
jgi:hypothetical protein